MSAVYAVYAERLRTPYSFGAHVKSSTSERRSHLRALTTVAAIAALLLSGTSNVASAATAKAKVGGICYKAGATTKIGKFTYVCAVDLRKPSQKVWTVPSAAPRAGGNLRVALPALPATIDPYATSLQADWIVARNVCEPLFDIDTAYAVQPVLADSIAYENPTTAVIKLRKGVSFQNGEPFQAKDVISSLKRFVLTPGNGAGFKAVLDSLVEVDPYTVKLNLKIGSPLVTTYLTAAYMMPASIQDGQSATKAVDKLVCTGPFTVEEFTPGQRVVLKKWRGYKPVTTPSNGATGRKTAWVDQVTVVPIGAESTRIQALATNSIDVTTASLDNAPVLLNSYNVRAAYLDMSLSPFLIFNKREGWMAKTEMRQAFLLALNMDDIMASGFGDKNNYRVEGSVFPKGNAWYSTSGTSSYNAKGPASAVQALLDKAGYKGEPIIWFTTKEDPTWYGPAPAAVEQLKKVGINVDLRVVDRATIIATRTDTKKYDMFSSAIPVYADPILIPYFLDTFPGYWTNAAKNGLLKQLADLTTFKERKPVWDKLQELMWTEVPFIKFGTVCPGVIAINKNFTMPSPQYNYSYWFNIYQTAAAAK